MTSVPTRPPARTVKKESLPWDALADDKVKFKYYGEECHGLSPTISRWCPLRSVDVHGLREVGDSAVKGVYYHLNHPIKWVRLTGLVVAFDELTFIKGPPRVVITIDDSSGMNIEATCLAPERVEPALLAPVGNELYDAQAAARAGETSGPAAAAVPLHAPQRISPDGPNLTHVAIGKVVKVKAGLKDFRDERQLVLKAISIIEDTNAEIKAWNETLAFRRDVLRRPWVVSPEEEEKCREVNLAEKAYKEVEQQRVREREMAEERRRKRRRMMMLRHEQTQNEGERGSKRRATDGLGNVSSKLPPLEVHNGIERSGVLRSASSSRHTSGSRSGSKSGAGSASDSAAASTSLNKPAALSKRALAAERKIARETEKAIREAAAGRFSALGI